MKSWELAPGTEARVPSLLGAKSQSRVCDKSPRASVPTDEARQTRCSACFVPRVG